MALGAQRDQLLQLMLFDGLRLRQTASSVSWTVDGKTGHRAAGQYCPNYARHLVGQ